MYDISAQTLLMRLISMLLLTPLLGLAAAFIARLLGDGGPAEDGRLTLNPGPHLDLVGLAGAAAFGIGWVRPVGLTPSRLRGGVLGLAALIVALTVLPLTVALLADMLQVVAARSFSDSTAPLVGGFLAILAQVAVGTALFNLIPVPPLVAGYLLGLAPALQERLSRASLVIGIVLLVALATGYPQLITRAVGGALGLV